MKLNFQIALSLVLSSILNSCNAPPTAPSLKENRKNPSPVKDKGDGDTDGEAGTENPNSGLGEDVKVGASTEDYLNLVCNKTDTRRGIRAWRRLSNVEIANTAKDVFGVTDSTVDFGSLIADMPKNSAFDTVQASENFMDINRFKGYVTLAQDISKAIDYSKIFPCKSEGANCLSQKISELGLQAWRRPLTAEDTTLFTELFKNLVSDGVTTDGAFGYVIQALILSPNFMYRSELGVMNDAKEFELSSWEVASALSYLIWRHPPDAQLRELAKGDRLKTSEAITKEAKRLLADPKAKIAMGEFGNMWFDGQQISNTNKADPKFTQAAKDNLQDEVKNLFINTMFDAKNGTFQELLNSKYTPGNATSAFIYGSMPGADGKILYKEEQRRGILGQASFLASRAFTDTPNPITRGAFVAKRLLCVDFGQVPAIPIPELKVGISNKERFAVHSKFAACAPCHAMLDPFGFALENFDINGAFRSMDAGQPISIDEKFTLDGEEVDLHSAADLSKAIGESRQGLECFVRQAFRYTLGRREYAPTMLLGAAPAVKDSVQSKLDSCEIEATTSELQKNGGQLQSAILSLVASPAFRLRLMGQLPDAGTIKAASLNLTGAH